MKKLIFLTQFLIFINYGNAIDSKLDSSNNTITEIKGDLFLNLTFVKIDENHDTYNLEKAIDEAKLYLKTQFKPFKINFHFQASMELEISSKNLISSWKENSLPHFEEELILYVYPAPTNLKTNHSYSFLSNASDIGIIPFYNQEEFNYYVLKNILHMLGVQVISFQTWKANQENPFEIFESKNLAYENSFFVEEWVTWNFSKGKQRYILGKKKSSKKMAFLNRQIAYIARKNMNNQPILLAKKTCYSFPIATEAAFNARGVNTITQLD